MSEPETNRQWRLAKRPTGMIDDSCFTRAEEPAPHATADGEIVVRNTHFSIDPTQRGWISRDTYMPAVKLGDVIRSGAAGRVVESRAKDVAVGDVVAGMFGWQDYALVKPSESPVTKVPPGMSVELAMSALGLTGITAYFGLLDVGRPKPGETVVVSGAAGATGSAVGQIARIKGCRAIGLAGGREKCDWLVRELKFDAAIDYKSEDVAARLKDLCPNGIDVYFDNVGGDLLDVALARLAMRGRIVLCGAIATYNDAQLRPGPKNYLNLLLKRGRMEGFLVFDYFPRAHEARAEMMQWIKEGKFVDRVDVMTGFENAPSALRRLFEGKNVGKQLVKIAD